MLKPWIDSRTTITHAGVVRVSWEKQPIATTMPPQPIITGVRGPI